MICKSAALCPKKLICGHTDHHDRKEDYDNNCAAPCDVSGGIAGSVCIEPMELQDGEPCRHVGCLNHVTQITDQRSVGRKE